MGSYHQVSYLGCCKTPAIANQYPGLESCLPGGPSITPNTACNPVAPETASQVPDLTTSSATTVQGLGCFHPGNCPAAAATTKAPEPAASAAAVQASGTASPGTSPTVTSATRAQPCQVKSFDGRGQPHICNSPYPSGTHFRGAESSTISTKSACPKPADTTTGTVKSFDGRSQPDIYNSPYSSGTKLGDNTVLTKSASPKPAATTATTSNST